MRIRIHPETTDGKPIPGYGTVVEAETPAGLVEAMHGETPFSAEPPLARYMDRILDHVQGEAREPLPADPDAAATEFLLRLAQNARIEFLPDDFREEPEPAPATEMNACADSRTK